MVKMNAFQARLVFISSKKTTEMITSHKTIGSDFKIYTHEVGYTYIACIRNINYIYHLPRTSCDIAQKKNKKSSFPIRVLIIFYDNCFYSVYLELLFIHIMLILDFKHYELRMLE